MEIGEKTDESWFTEVELYRLSEIFQHREKKAFQFGCKGDVRVLAVKIVKRKQVHGSRI